MITEEQAKQRLAQIAMMPSVVMVGVDSEQNVSIGMELEKDKANVTGNVDDLLMGLMTAYVGICLHAGLSKKALIARAADTMTDAIKNLTESKDAESVTIH